MADEDKTKGKAQRPGFDDKGKPYPGVSETGERLAVTLEGLKREFGPKRGEDIYYQIGEATATLSRNNPGTYTPDISLGGASVEVRAKVDEILTAKE